MKIGFSGHAHSFAALVTIATTPLNDSVHSSIELRVHLPRPPPENPKTVLDEWQTWQAKNAKQSATRPEV